MGKLRLLKFCQNKYVSTAGTVRPNSRKKIFLAPEVSFFSTIYLAYQNKFQFSLILAFFQPACNLVVLSSSNFLARDLQYCSFENNSHLISVFTHEIRRQMLACFETLANVIQSAPMTDFSFGFTDCSFVL